MDQRKVKISGVTVTPELMGFVSRFAGMHKNLAVPANAADECWYTSEAFLEYLAKRCVLPDLHGIMAVGSLPAYATYCSHGPHGHYAVRLGKICVDFTARQFHPNFAFPRIWLLTQKEEGWIREDPGSGSGEFAGWIAL